MTLQSSKLIRQQLLFHSQSKTRLTCVHQADGAQFEFNSNLRTAKGQKINSLVRRLSFSVVCSVVLFPASVVAQITPDNSVPTIVEQAEEIMRINGGEREGNNLFHSFDEFSIPEGMEATFENATDIENIFTRVTGGEVSNIDGILSTQGDANFFFINPNGIVFGDNASLNVGGSFIASTAESVQLEDGSEFSATNPSEPILDLTGFPVGLNLGELPGAISVNGTGNQITPNFSSNPTTVEDSATSLSVQPGNTLALIGGNINTNGATINASDGQIELASVNSGLVNFQPTENGFAFNFDDVANYQNITLDNQTVLNSSGSGRGDIFLDAANIDLSDGSLILIQNQGNIPSGTIDVNAIDSLTITGVSPDGNVSSNIRSEATSSGKAADINISTQKLVLQNAGRIGSISYADASSGNININSTKSVQLLENTLVNPNRQGYTSSNISTGSYGSGNAGNFQLTTSNFDITSGALVGSSAIGTGNSGSVNINADSIDVLGVNNLNPQDTNSSGIGATSNSGDYGNLTINTSQLQVKDGGTVTASTFGTGNAGKLEINASQGIDLTGLSSSINSNVSPVSDENARARAGTPLVPSGQGGNLIINTPSLNVNSGAEISVANQGLGNAGILTINAEDINLDNASSITATSASGNGGNINLNSDRLQIDNESQITTEAGNNGDGGNITINTSNLTAKKKQ
jgi:filamentous hemagglutinin family protein